MSMHLKIVHSGAMFSYCSVYANGRNLRASRWQRQRVAKLHALFFVRRYHGFSRFSHRPAGLVSGSSILLCRLSILPDSDSCDGLLYGVVIALAKSSWFWSIVAIVLAIGGFLAQWRTMQEYPLVWSEAQVPGGSSNV